MVLMIKQVYWNEVVNVQFILKIIYDETGFHLGNLSSLPDEQHQALA